MTDERTGEPIDDEPADDLELEEPAMDELDGSAADDAGLPDEDEALEDEGFVEAEPVAERRRRRPEERRAEQARRAGRGSAVASSRGRGFAIDPSLRIRDRWSQAFVILVVLVYLAIFLNAMAFGHGGAFTTTPEPTVVASESASPAASSSTAPTAAPTATPAASPQGS